MGESEACECQVNDNLICFGLTFSSFFKFGRAELPNFDVDDLEIVFLTNDFSIH
jgi:hypothetical protein